MLFSYKAVDKTSTPRSGTVEAQTLEAAIETVEKRGYTIIAIEPIEEKSSLLNIEFTWFERVSNKEVVILSRQIATLFEAQVSALRVFRLLSAESGNPKMQRIMTDISDSLQSGSTISNALAGHPDVFSKFYVSMIRSGEESGSLDKTFMYLADYLDRTYQVVSKARNALIYPLFVIGIMVMVVVIMLKWVIPSISKILVESGQELPIYTKIVIWVSDIFRDHFPLIVLLCAIAMLFLWQFQRTPSGKRIIDEMKLSIPVLGNLYEKLFLTRICDNLATMLGSGISMVQALEVTADVVENDIYKEIIQNTLVDVKAGKSFADAIAEYPEIPGVLSQMSKVGEETGKLGDILKTLSVFYNREVNNAVDTLISLIEPAMIVILGLGVGVLLASVLMPIYNLTGAI